MGPAVDKSRAVRQAALERQSFADGVAERDARIPLMAIMEPTNIHCTLRCTHAGSSQASMQTEVHLNALTLLDKTWHGMNWARFDCCAAFAIAGSAN